MTTRIVVAAGLCTPARVLVDRALAPYGVRYEATTSWMETGDGQITTQTDQAAIDLCAVLVSNQAARWAEYLLLRTGKLRLVSRPIDARNERWALRHRGNMPQPWVQPGCNIDQLPHLSIPTDGRNSAPRRQRREERPVRRRRRERY